MKTQTQNRMFRLSVSILAASLITDRCDVSNSGGPGQCDVNDAFVISRLLDAGGDPILNTCNAFMGLKSRDVSDRDSRTEGLPPPSGLRQTRLRLD